MKRLIDLTDTDLGQILRDVVADFIKSGRLEIPSKDRWLTVPQLCKRYAIGRTALLKLIEHGRLPATVRPLPGGKGWVVRVSDAESVLGGKPELRVVG